MEDKHSVEIYIPARGLNVYSLNRLKNLSIHRIEYAILLIVSIQVKLIKRGDYYTATAYAELYYHLEHEIYKRQSGTSTYNNN